MTAVEIYELQLSLLLQKEKAYIYTEHSPACCHLFVVGGLRTSVTWIAILAGDFILLVGPPRSDRLKDRGQTK